MSKNSAGEKAGMVKGNESAKHNNERSEEQETGYRGWNRVGRHGLGCRIMTLKRMILILPPRFLDPIYHCVPLTSVCIFFEN